MENYCKGKNEEEAICKENIPIKCLPDDFIWMQVRGGSKIRNLLDYALKEFPKTKTIVWTGSGQAVGKTITCAELMKKEHKNQLHQITKLCHRVVREFWDPLIPELDQIVVKRNLPMIHIFLSVDEIDTNELGYQPPGFSLQYNRKPNNNNNNNNHKNKNKNSRNVKKR